MDTVFTILEKHKLAEAIYRIKVNAPRIARKRKPGQFVIVRVHRNGERIPLTIVDSDEKRGSIDIIVQVVGKNTHILSNLHKGDAILDVAGPLGKPTKLKKYGTCVVVGGGVGIAPLFPIAKGLKEKGNKVISIIGARTKDLIILKKELQGISEKLFIATDDGSCGYKGLVSEVLTDFMQQEKIDYVVAVGPVVMMDVVCRITKKEHIKTMVSLNPIMIDGTGMCGGCRCTVGGEVKFACVDGPEFDGHLVDFTNLKRRLKMFHVHERHVHVGDKGCRIDGSSS